MDENDYQENEGVEVPVSPSATVDSDIVGIRFRNSGKTYCFSATGLQLSRSDRVVVESDMGINIGQVVKVRCELQSPGQDLKSVLRKVTEVDIRQEEENEAVKREARDYAVERIATRNLPMKLLYTDVTLDRKRFIFYFVADTRIDFRELVKDLASKFRTRIELRQIGVRDAAKMIGGFGICGQELCCKTWLRSFAPISIKMAKQQDLVLNTCKLSGSCGRLMCCLNYEYDPEEPKRRKKDVVEDKAAMQKARGAAIEEAIASRYEDSPEAVESAKADSRPARRAPSASDANVVKQDAKAVAPVPAGEGSEDEGVRKKKRRRGGRRRKKQEQKVEASGGKQAPQEARREGQQKQAPPRQDAPATGQGQEAAKKDGQGDAEKPKRSRKRRWRPRQKKEGGNGQQ